MVRMKCLTTKQDFDVENPEVLVLRNGRYAYRAPCPWEGPKGKQLHAFKFASKVAYAAWADSVKEPTTPERKVATPEKAATPEKGIPES